MFRTFLRTLAGVLDLSHVCSWWQTFRNRLVEVIDQAQHFAALGPAGGGGQSGDTALTFREGLEVTEREREFFFILSSFPFSFRH
jgi:hypothetical protein